ncbi:unnamed protein product [Eruca vesicaria subsp. sativa]|uniref:Uncharacterized protein n=1 Tax=Eruca vesicaria subsp. sativa TaxID=29727 RepID=A0ABC8JBE2_ERUVS|nr:unnamed protein product [Eruca vesicaria subsp. sativa]
MGVAIALEVHLKEPLAWDGVIFVAPMCKISKDVKHSKHCFPNQKIFPKKDMRELFFRDSTKRKLNGNECALTSSPLPMTLEFKPSMAVKSSNPRSQDSEPML